MVDLGSESTGTNTDSGKWLSQVKVQESRLLQEVGPNQEVETQIHIHFPTTECNFDPQICDPVQIPESILTSILLSDLSNILESVLIPIPVILELESPILESHIPLWENECRLEFQLLDLDSLPEPILTPEPLLDFNKFPESVLVHVLPEFKSIIPSFHTSFLDVQRY